MIMIENEKLSFQIKFNVPQRKTHNVNKENGVAAKKKWKLLCSAHAKIKPQKKTNLNQCHFGCVLYELCNFLLIILLGFKTFGVFCK
jgi:hypothetical protein